MDDIVSTLLSFRPISLEEMDHVKLLDRIDTKYVIHQEDLPRFLQAVVNDYRLLVIDNQLIHPYETLYFDTPEFFLYQMHHNGRRTRYKLRFRKYVSSGLTFFEIKSKNNKARTIKKRMVVDSIPQRLDDSLNQFISKHTPGIYSQYLPALQVYFDRMTLVNIRANERLTIDLNLRYIVEGIEKKMQNLVIVEVKQDKNVLSPFRQLMKSEHQPHNFLSKYCMGIVSMNKGLKMNRFKQKMKSLTKLGYDIY
jgi:hypothetical protein